MSKAISDYLHSGQINPFDQKNLEHINIIKDFSLEDLTQQ